MGKKGKIKATAKKVVQKVLDSTELDEQIIANINENLSLYSKILCYTKCYGGYLLAVGAGCTFGANIWWGLGLLAASGIWAYKTTCACNPCKGGDGTCCNG